MRLIDDGTLRRLIESDLILQELNALGVDNWFGYSEIEFPSIEEIEDKTNQYTKVDINIDKFRLGLIGLGYLYDEVMQLSKEELVDILLNKVHNKIEGQYQLGLRVGLIPKVHEKLIND